MKALIQSLFMSLVVVPFVSGCSKPGESETSHRILSAAQLIQGADGAYTPDRSIIGAPVLKGSVGVSTTSQQVSGVPMVRFNDPWGGALSSDGIHVTGGHEVTVNLGSFNSARDFGANGSISLMAEVQNYPIAGGAYPILTGFFVVQGDGSTTDYLKVSPSCRTQGMWSCDGSGNCTENAACTVLTGSAFGGRSDWDQHQVPPFGFVTTNLFPRCDSSVNSWSCPFSGGLVSGTYFANYLLLSNSGDSVSKRTADLKVSTVIKNDGVARSPASLNGGLNLNLILVGDQNIVDSRGVAGARNLNLLFKELNRLFSVESGAHLGINEIKIYEWTNTNGASQYSQVSLDGLGDLFESGSKGVDASDDGRAINLFLVSDIQNGNVAYTILGLSGAILGPVMNGTQASGLAFSSFNSLSDFNAGCSSNSCSRDSLDAEFLEMAATIAHELGHYLGLNHPTEKPTSDPTLDSSYLHDVLSDTPKALARKAGTSILFDQRSVYGTLIQDAPLKGSCKSACDAVTGSTPYLELDPLKPKTDAFCPSVPECQFNHIMWYTTKYRKKNTSGVWVEDGNQYSPQSSAVIEWSPFLR
jgi:hypothetical protein